MNRASLGFLFSFVILAFPTVSRAADPAGQEKADPFAPDAKTPSTEDEEAAVLGAPPPPAPPPPAPRPAAPARRQADDDEGRPAHRTPPPKAETEKETDQGGIVFEFSTAAFASGTLASGGLLIGGRTASGMIIGGFIDYSLTSVTSTPPAGVETSISDQTFRLGVGVRQGFVRTADRRAELYGAADVSFDYKSTELGGNPSPSFSAAGFSLALGPGVRLWVTDQISIGYVARFRLAFLSGEAGALVTPAIDDPSDAKLTQIGFDGVFQILAVF